MEAHTMSYFSRETCGPQISSKSYKEKYRPRIIIPKYLLSIFTASVVLSDDFYHAEAVHFLSPLFRHFPSFGYWPMHPWYEFQILYRSHRFDIFGRMMDGTKKGLAYRRGDVNLQNQNIICWSPCRFMGWVSCSELGTQRKTISKSRAPVVSSHRPLDNAPDMPTFCRIPKDATKKHFQHANNQ